MNHGPYRPRLFICLLLLSLAGCGFGSKLKPVSGVLTLDGKPLSNVTVMFNPASDGEGRQLAHGLTDESGRFQLTTVQLNDGAAPGDYLVTLSWVPPANSAPPSAESDPVKAMAVARTATQPPSPVHINYASKSTTPLKVTLPAAGSVELKITAAGSTP